MAKANPPAIGQPVQYNSTKGAEPGGFCVHAALVTAVYDRGALVDLQVFGPFGPYRREDVPQATEPRADTWNPLPT